MPIYLSTYVKNIWRGKRLGRKWYWGETTRVCGAKRLLLGLKIEAKRLGWETTGGETSCYRSEAFQPNLRLYSPRRQAITGNDDDDLGYNMPRMSARVYSIMSRKKEK